MKYCFIIVCPEQTERGVDHKELKEVYSSIKKFFVEYNKTHYNRTFEFISSNSNVLLMKTEKREEAYNSTELRGGEDYRYFREFTALLRGNKIISRKISDYSAKIGITTRKLSDICRFYKNKNPKKIISEYLISESKRLLTKTSNSIKQIASQLGFSDQYQFSKYFKKHTKSSPALYRRKSNAADI
jgi:AraC family transcriptional regulator, transcriptional activator of pobA